MSVYAFLDYKAFLKKQLQSQERKRGLRSALARAIGIQASFLSHVLNTHVHFTPEHALATAQFFGLAADETEYFVELVHLARAGTRALQDHQRAKVERLRKAAMREKVQPSPPVLSGDAAKALYYSSWHYTAVHFALTLPHLRTPRAISQALQIPLEIVQRSLGELAAIGLTRAKESGKRAAPADQEWEVLVSDMTAEYGSPYGSLHALHWAHRAAQDISLRKTQGAFHFAAVFGASSEDFRRLKAASTDYLGRAREISEDARKKEKLVALSCHLFEV